jgi:hypothetical protein
VASPASEIGVSRDYTGIPRADEDAHMTSSPLLAALALVSASAVACGGGDDDTIPPPQTFRLSWGPVTVDPGVERTECIILDVGNDTPIDVHRIHNTLGLGSHHLVVYRDNAATAPTGLYPCAPFASSVSSNGNTAPMMITQKHDEELVLPEGVAYHLAAHQLLRLEVHYLNSTDAPLTIEASVELDTTTDVPITEHADFLFIGTPDIHLGPGETTTVDAFFTPPERLAAANYFAITGHTHQYGTNVTVGYGADSTATMTPVYDLDDFRWSDPETVVHTPAFQVPAGGGFQLTCEYTNTSGGPVEFGESANDEMCFFWAYYYPSVGSFVCAHTAELIEPGLDVCCPPEPGDAVAEILCARLAEELTPPE